MNSKNMKIFTQTLIEKKMLYRAMHARHLLLSYLVGIQRLRLFFIQIRLRPRTIGVCEVLPNYNFESRY